MNPLAAEARKLLGLAVPVAATQVSTMLMGFVDTVMVGRVSVDAIASASLANVWIFGTIMFANGVILGMDPLVTQAHGAGRGEAAGLAFQRGIALALVLSVPVGGLFLLTEQVLLLTRQDPSLAAAAGDYARVQVASVPFFLSYTALRQYLQGRELVRPALWVILAANVFNVFFNWALIFGHLGLPALGLVGAGIATAATRVVALVGLALWVLGFQLHRGAWTPWTREALHPRALATIAALGLPVAIQHSLEIWAFSGAALLAGWLGAVPLAAHTVALNMAALAFMVPLGVSQGAVTRVGNLIGAGRREASQRAAWVAMALGAAVMTISASGFVLLRHQLPRIYTTDADVIAACAAILPIAAAFQIFDGTQVVGCGVLRGMARTRPAAWFNLLGYWVLGIPAGAWLAFRADLGLPGIWWGLCLGLLVVSVLLVIEIQQRGPAQVERTALQPDKSLESTIR
jgi:MATE family multidrug resistance protein